jgi:hypothetical protein
LNASALFSPTAARCTATSKRSHEPCKNPAIAGGRVCRFHGGGAPHVKAAAQARLQALQFPAIAKLGALLERDDAPHVQLAAAKDVLDRTMGKPATAVDVSGPSGPVQFTWAGERPPVHVDVHVPWRTPATEPEDK